MALIAVVVVVVEEVVAAVAVVTVANVVAVLVIIVGGVYCRSSSTPPPPCRRRPLLLRRRLDQSSDLPLIPNPHHVFARSWILPGIKTCLRYAQDYKTTSVEVFSHRRLSHVQEEVLFGLWLFLLQ